MCSFDTCNISCFGLYISSEYVNNVYWNEVLKKHECHQRKHIINEIQNKLLLK